MTRDDITQMAREAALPLFEDDGIVGPLQRFAEIVAAAEREACIENARTVGGDAGAEMEKLIRARGQEWNRDDINKLANWMIAKGYATGHGETMEDLLAELEWQIAEGWNRAMINGVTTEREACIDIVARHGGSVEIEAAIRARGQQ